MQATGEVIGCGDGESLSSFAFRRASAWRLFCEQLTKQGLIWQGIVVALPTDMSRTDEESTAQAEAGLAGVLRELRDEVEVLRIAIDELREEIQTAVRNVLQQPRESTCLTSLPRDSCAPNFGAQVNQVDSQQRESLRQEAIASQRTARTKTALASQGDVQPSCQPANRPAQPASAARHSKQPTPSVTEETTRPVSETSLARSKRQPLYLRIYQERVLTDVVRLIGYETLSEDEARRRLEPLSTQYGPERLSAATAELLSESFGGSNQWKLSQEARQAARALLGPPPVESACGALAPGINPLTETRTDQAQPARAARSTRHGAEVKAARKVVLARFREHLDETEEVTDEVPDDIQKILVERGRMTPDFILGETEPYELLAVRRTLTSVQRHDMEQWLEVSEFGSQATRVWPYQTAGGWEWEYEIVASRDSEKESETSDGGGNGDRSR